MKRTCRVGIGLLAVALFASGCYGPFNLTRRLYRWNGQVGDKWANEFAFLVLAWLPVYGLATLGDALIFNSIEFWGGKNPVEPPTARHDGSTIQTKRIVRGNDEALLTRVSGVDGEQLIVEQFQQGRPAGSLHIRQRDGMTVASNADGETLLSAQTLPDGSILVSDVQGKQVAFYSADEVEGVVKSARQ